MCNLFSFDFLLSYHNLTVLSMGVGMVTKPFFGAYSRVSKLASEAYISTANCQNTIYLHHGAI